MRTLILVLPLLFIACSKKDQRGTNQSTFVYCSEGSPSGFNPQITTDGTSANAGAETVYNRLVDFDHGKTNLVPSLAESWEVTNKGKTYTFKLKKNVVFHQTDFFTPTRPMNADDVLFSFNRQFDKKHPFHPVSGATYEYFYGMGMDKTIKSLSKVDDHTVRFDLNYPEAPFVANLAMGFSSILSKEYADQMMAAGTPEKIDRFPVGTGPFRFKSYQKDLLIRYEANQKYFEGKPSIDKLVFAITPDASVRFQKLKTGECHLINEPLPTDIASMKKINDIKVMQREGMNVGYLALNTQKKPFDNPLVRRAIHHALNRQSYVDAIYLGNAKVAKNPIPPALWSYNDDIEDYDYNPSKARTLLKKAGLPNGFTTELWTLPVSRPYNPNGKKMGEMMQADLAKVGIKAKLITYDWPTYLSKSRKGEQQMIQLGWTGDNGDPDNFMNILLGCNSVDKGSNVARWCHPEYDRLIQEAKKTPEQKKREKLYRKAQEIFKREAPWVPIAHSITFRGMKQRVEGYVMDPMGHDYFFGVSLK